MTDYRFTTSNGLGPTKPRTYFCNDDSEALRLAEKIGVGGSSCEVWHMSRLVGRTTTPVFRMAVK